MPMSKSLKIILAFILLSISGRAYSQVDTIVWQQLSPLPDGLSRVVSGYFLIDSDFYVAGGQLGGGAPCTSTVWKYHIPTDSWRQMQNLPFGPASSYTSFVLNEKGYFLTELDSVSNYNCDTTFWEYNPVIDNWTQKAGFPDNPRNISCAFSYEGKGYVCFTYGCIGEDNHVWQYDPISNLWTQMMTQPGQLATAKQVATSTPNSAYFIGGWYDLSGNMISDLWRYKIDSNSWDSIGKMPGLPRCYPTIWGFDSILIGGGGLTSDNVSTLNLGDDFYLYDVANNTWSPIIFQNSFDSTAYGCAFVYKRLGYYFGGQSAITPNWSFSNNLWSFNASRFFPPDTTAIKDTTGIASLKSTVTFSLYPNPVSHEQGFSVSTSENGEIVFNDALGRTLDERKLVRGINQVKFHTDDEVVFYRATLSSGATQNGKVVFIR